MCISVWRCPGDPPTHSSPIPSTVTQCPSPERCAQLVHACPLPFLRPCCSLLYRPHTPRRQQGSPAPHPALHPPFRQRSVWPKHSPFSKVRNVNPERKCLLPSPFPSHPPPSFSDFICHSSLPPSLSLDSCSVTANTLHTRPFLHVSLPILGLTQGFPVLVTEMCKRIPLQTGLATVIGEAWCIMNLQGPLFKSIKHFKMKQQSIKPSVGPF